MTVNYMITFMFSSHLILLAAKLWAFKYFMDMLLITETPNTEKYILVFKRTEGVMSIFTFIIICAELYFLYGFFVVTKLYFYEYLSILDQIFLTILVINYIKLEGKKS